MPLIHRSASPCRPVLRWDPPLDTSIPADRVGAFTVIAQAGWGPGWTARVSGAGSAWSWDARLHGHKADEARLYVAHGTARSREAATEAAEKALLSRQSRYRASHGLG